MEHVRACATFTGRAHYSDGFSQIVVPDTWTIIAGASFAEITIRGILTAYEANGDGTVGIMASYTEGQSTRSDEIQATVNGSDTRPVQ